MSTRPVAAPAPAPGFEVIPGRRFTVPRLRGWVVFTLAVVMAFFLLIFSRTTLDHTAFEIKDLETRIAAEESRYWELRLEIARLQAPDRIMEAAGELNLVYPEEIRNVTVAIEGGPAMSLDDRWAELKALLSAHP